MKNLKKTFALLVALITLFAVLVSCDGDNGGDTETTAGASTETTAAETEYSGYNGATVKIMYRSSDEGKSEFDPDASTKDSVEYSIYKRNHKVESELDIDLDFTGNANISWLGGYTSYITEDVKSGDGEYSVFSGPVYYMALAIPDGSYADLNGISTLSPGEEYWTENKTAINGKLYLITGDITLSYTKDCCCLIYNGESYSDIVKTVKDGEFTAEYFLTAIKDKFSDFNKDCAVTEGDIFGLAVQSSSEKQSFIDALGVDVMKTGEGEATLYTDNKSHICEIFKTVRDLWFDGDVYIHSDVDEISEVYNENRADFILTRIKNVSTVAGYNANLLPLPKYDEGGEYAVTICGTESVFGISSAKTDEEKELAGAVLDLLGKISRDDVTPEYLKSALGIEYGGETDNAVMLSYILDGRTLNGNVLYNIIVSDMKISILDRCLDKTAFNVSVNKNWDDVYSSNSSYWKDGIELLNGYFSD